MLAASTKEEREKWKTFFQVITRRQAFRCYRCSRRCGPVSAATPRSCCVLQPFVVAPERSDSDSKGRRRSQVDATQEKYYPGKLIVEVRTNAGFGSLAGPISGLSSGEGRVADACTAVREQMRAQACQRVKNAAQLKDELIAAYGRPCCNAC